MDSDVNDKAVYCDYSKCLHLSGETTAIACGNSDSERSRDGNDIIWYLVPSVAPWSLLKNDTSTP